MLRIRKFLLLELVLLLLGLFYQATSYSSAITKNHFSVNISSSENALITIPKEDIIVNIQIECNKTSAPNKLLMKNESLRSVFTSGNINNIKLLNHNLTIKNNMEEKLINVHAFLKDNPDLMQFYYDEPIMPGQEVTLSFIIDKNNENIDFIAGSDDKPLILLISADWDGGSAEIEKNIRVIFESYESIVDHSPAPTVPEKTAAPKPKDSPSAQPAPTSTPTADINMPSPKPTLGPVEDYTEQGDDLEPDDSNLKKTAEPDDGKNSNG